MYVCIYDTIEQLPFKKVCKTIQFLDKQTPGYRATILVISKGLLRLKKRSTEEKIPGKIAKKRQFQNFTYA